MFTIATITSAQIKKTTAASKPKQATTSKEITYQSVTIGNQVWMSKNLDVSTFSNGDPIPQAQTSPAWRKAAKEKKPAWCYYQVPNEDIKYFGNPEQTKKYGKLYNFYAISDPRGLAPKGWQIPNEKDWIELLQYVENNVQHDEYNTIQNVAKALKSKSGWFDKNAWAKLDQGSDMFGLNILPAGERGSEMNAFFEQIGSTTQIIVNEPIFQDDGNDDVVEVFFLTDTDHSFVKLSPGDGFSVRCVKAKEYQPTAQDYYNNGYAKFNAKDYNGAIEEYTKAIALSPDSFLCYYSRGNSKAWLDKWDEARIDFEKSWKLIQSQNLYKDPSVNLVLFGLGNAYYNSNKETSCFYFNEALKYGSEGAKEFVKKCNEEKVNELLKSGYSKLTNKDFQGAIKDYTNSIELSPNKECLVCFFQRAETNGAMENWNSAVLDYLSTWRIIKKGNYNDETKATALLSLGYAFSKINNLDYACYFLNEAVKFKSTKAKEYMDKLCNKGEKVLEKEPEVQQPNGWH